VVGVEGADVGALVDVFEEVVPVVDEEVDELGGESKICDAGGIVSWVEVAAGVVPGAIVEGTIGADEMAAGEDSDGVAGVPGVPGVPLGVELAIEAGT
jgi:hypothetical protein